MHEAQGHRKNVHIVGQRKYQQDQLADNSLLVPVKGAFGIMDSIDHKSSHKNVEQDQIFAGLKPAAVHTGHKDADSRLYYGTPNAEGQVFLAKSQQSPRSRRKIGMTIEHNARVDKMNDPMPFQNEYLKQGKRSMLDPQLRTHHQHPQFADAAAERSNRSPSRRNNFVDMGSKQKTQILKNQIILKPENITQSSKGSRPAKSKEA